MTEKSKKIILIIGFIAIVIAIALLLYYLFFKQFVSPPVTVTPPPPVVGLPEIPPALTIPLAPAVIPTPLIPTEIPTIPVAPIIPGPAISDQAIGGLTSYSILETSQTKNLSLANNGLDLNYYNTQTGLFYTITPNGEKKLLSDLAFRNVENVTWAPNNEKAILEYPDGSNIIYDFKNKRSVTLPTQWKDFTFSNDGTQIAFKDMRMDPENRYIAVSDSNGTSYRKIEKLGTKDETVYITWAPNNQYIALYSESVDGSRADVYPIGFNGENFRKFRVEGRDLKFAWSPDGNKLVYSVYNSRSNYNPSLWVVNSSPDLLASGRTNLGIATWADKCTFASSNIIYCAVPRTLEKGSGLRPDFAANTPDDLYRINILTGSKELIAQPLYNTTIGQIIVSEDNKYLYWLESNSGQIKKINL